MRSNFPMFWGLFGAFITNGKRYAPEEDRVSHACLALVYCLFYESAWETMNQWSGEEQDNVNRPGKDGRVLELKLIKKANLWYMIWIHAALFIGFGAWMGLFPHTACIWLSCLWYNLLGGDRHWTKQFAVSFFVMAPLVEAPHTYYTGAYNWTYVVVQGFVTACDLILADIKDVDGDRKAGRRTFPIVYGDAAARALIVSCVFWHPIVVAYFLVDLSQLWSWQFLVPTLWRLPLLWLLRKQRTPTEYGVYWIVFGWWWENLLLTLTPLVLRACFL
jgi:4-hydroxybenzoate polyprenyltransferase